jgi:hypothetical protein
MMNAQTANEAITDLNRRFVDLCTRATNEELPEMSVKLNCSSPFLRELRELSYDEREVVINSGRLLLQPAIGETSVRRAPNLKTGSMINLFISASSKVLPESH